jgi:hypothetical protein
MLSVPLEDGMELVLEISDVEIIAKAKTPVGKELFSHQWLHREPFEKWSPCCHPVPVQLGIGVIQQQCKRYGKINQILEKEGPTGMQRRILSGE